MALDRLLDPVDVNPPSGAELRNDARFFAIQRLLEPASRANQLNSDGTINESAPEVEWQQVLDDSLALAEEGRDLRLLVIVVRALAQTEGYPGLARGLTLLTETLELYWDSLHPDLRDRPDPAAATLPRLNALKQLENDDNGLLGDLKYSIAFTKRGLGAVWGIQLAEAALSEFEALSRAPSGLSQQERDAIASAHAQTVNRVSAASKALAAEEAETAQGLLAGLKDSEAALSGLTAKFAEKGGFAEGLGLALPELDDFLKHCRKTMETALAEISGAVAGAEPGAPAGEASAEGAAGAAGGGPQPGVRAPGTIASRTDVEECLDRIVEFYDRTEPSSPIPFFLRRVRRMVQMDFAELMEEVAPGGIKDFQALAGIKDGGQRGRRGKSSESNE